jgi:hypothetical protein
MFTVRNFMIASLAVFAFGTYFFFVVGCAGVPKPTGISIDASEGGIEACITLAKKNGCACPADAGAKDSAPPPDAAIVGR